MGCIEDLWKAKDGARKPRYGAGKRYRAVPWLPDPAGTPGRRGRRGATKTFHHYRDAEFYIARVQRGDDAARAGAAVDAIRRRPWFADYVREVANTMDKSSADPNRGSVLAAVWPTQYVDEITADMIEIYFEQLYHDGVSILTRAARESVVQETMLRAFRAGHIGMAQDESILRVLRKPWPEDRPERRRLPEVSLEEMREAMTRLPGATDVA